MVTKALAKMKSGKAAGPSGIIVEMLKAAGSKGIVFLRELTKSVVKHGKIPEDWEMSFILNLYKGKGDALNRGNYRGLKLTEHVMKVMERIVDGMIREMIAIDEMQFAFVPGRGTTDAIFIIRQLQEKFLSRKDLNDKNLTLFFAFVDLEKAFDRVLRKVLWWAMRKVGVEEWIVRLVQAMYNNARNHLRWFGHVMRSNGEINRVRSRPVPGRKGPGRPTKTWEECVKQDLKVCGLSEAGTQDRLSWRSSVKNSRQEPTPSNGSLLQSMAAPPARRVLGMRTRSFNKTGFDWLIDWHIDPHKR